MQEIKLQPFNKEVLQKKYLQIIKKIIMQTLVVTPSFKKNTIECQKSLPSTHVPSSNQTITQMGCKFHTSLMSECKMMIK
jgi:hypothetical protein